jgi:hypothetical protein
MASSTWDDQHTLPPVGANFTCSTHAWDAMHLDVPACASCMRFHHRTARATQCYTTGSRCGSLYTTSKAAPLPTPVMMRKYDVCTVLMLQAKLTPHKGMLVRTMDVGGAGP